MALEARYPQWLRRELYRLGLEHNIVPPEGRYERPAIRPAPFYHQFGTQFAWDIPYSGYAVARVGGDVALAKGFLENMLSFAFTDGADAGMIPRNVAASGSQGGVMHQDGSQMSTLSWLALELHHLEPDEAFLARVYPSLAGAIDWWQSPRRDHDRDGLSEHAGTSPTFAVYESGHDYSPERDLVMGEPTAPSDDGLIHEPIADVFLNGRIHAELDALADIAEIVDVDRAEEWSQRRDAMRDRMSEAMWDEQVGGFFPVVRRDLCPTQPRVYRHTPALLMPLWAGVATDAQAQRTVDVVRGRPRRYPDIDGVMTVRLDAGLYHGYQIRTDGLHPTAGAGAAAGGVELTADGFLCRFAPDRGPAAAAFRRFEVEVTCAADPRPDAHVEVELIDGDGDVHVLLSGTPDEGRLRAEAGQGASTGTTNEWFPGITQMRLRSWNCSVQELALHYAAAERGGLMARYGIRSAHPLDGKHPAPEAPTEFWSGTVWGPQSFHACYGLRRYGYESLARTLALAHMDGVTASFLSTGNAMEHHDADTAHGLGVGNYTWNVGVALLLLTDFLEDHSG